MIKRKKMRMSEIISAAIMIMLAIITLFPFYIMVATSTKNQFEFATNFWGIRFPPVWDNYKTAFDAVKLYIFNSFKVSTTATLITMITVVLAAYAFSRMRFKGRKVLFKILIILIFMPMPMLLVQRFVIKYHLGLYNNHLALWVGCFAPVYNIVIAKGFFDNIPTELFESMKIDGATEFTIITRLLIPLSVSILGTLALITFIGAFNDFMTPFIYLSDEHLFTIPIGLMSLEGAYGANYGILMAGYSMIAIPLMMLMVICQKSYLKGLTLGAVKG